MRARPSPRLGMGDMSRSPGAKTHQCTSCVMRIGLVELPWYLIGVETEGVDGTRPRLHVGDYFAPLPVPYPRGTPAIRPD